MKSINQKKIIGFVKQEGALTPSKSLGAFFESLEGHYKEKFGTDKTNIVLVDAVKGGGSTEPPLIQNDEYLTWLYNELWHELEYVYEWKDKHEFTVWFDNQGREEYEDRPQYQERYIRNLTVQNHSETA